MLNGAWRSLFQIFRLPLLTTMLKQQSKQHGDPNPTENSRSDYSVINKTFVFLIKGIIPCPLVPHHKFPTSILDRCVHFSTLVLRWKWAKRSKRAFFLSTTTKKRVLFIVLLACINHLVLLYACCKSWPLSQIWAAIQSQTLHTIIMFKGKKSFLFAYYKFSPRRVWCALSKMENDWISSTLLPEPLVVLAALPCLPGLKLSFSMSCFFSSFI